MTPFVTLNNYTLEAFAGRAAGPFSFLEYGVQGTSQATLRADTSRTIRVTAFYRVGHVTGSRHLCAVLAEDYVNPKFSYSQILAEVA